MKKIVVFVALGMLALAVPVQAAPNGHGHGNGTGNRCKPHKAGYYAVGSLIDISLTATTHHRFDGTVEANLRRANHKAPTGDQTFALDGARVRFHHGVDPTDPAVGSRVKLHGKITALPRRCDASNFTPTIVVKRVDVSQKPTKQS